MAVRKLVTKPFSEVKGLQLNYLDDSISFSGEHYATSEGFDFTLYDAFDNYNDLTVNNYSYFVLGKKDKFSNWAQYKKAINETNAYMTVVKFNLFTQGTYLYFDREQQVGTFKTANTWDAPVILHTEQYIASRHIDIEQLKYITEYLFIVEFIPGTNQCFIKHIEENKHFYLYNRRYYESTESPIPVSKDDMWFTTDRELAEKFGMFGYVINGGKISLFLSEKNSIQINLDSNTSIWVDYKNNVENSSGIYKLKKAEGVYEPYIYPIADQYVGRTFSSADIAEYGRVRSIIAGDTLLLADNKSISPTLTIDSTVYDTICDINTEINTITSEDYLNSSWLSFADPNNVQVDLERSLTNIDSQCLFHIQYNNIDEDFASTVNIIPLKNHMSSMDNAIRGDYMNNTEQNIPNIDFREYTTLRTGSNQEFGSTVITLNYTFYDTEYIVNPGEDFTFNVRADDNTLGEGVSAALYPFIKLNINDTNFVKNGAFGSTAPFLSDKIKKLQQNSQFINNGRYLNTWLYQSEKNPYGIWLDRYYYPDKISKREALQGKSHFDPSSFTDIIDADYYASDKGGESFLAMTEDILYFDKVSDLVLEPDTQYIYSRVDGSEFKDVIDTLSLRNITDIEKYTSSDKTLIIDNISAKDTGILDISYKMWIEPGRNYGPCILSNSQTNGLAINHLKTVSPFAYTWNGATVRLSNWTSEVVKEINLNELFNTDETIIGSYNGAAFKDLCVYTDKAFYILAYDLLVKSRFAFDEINFYDTPVILSYYISKNVVYFLTANIDNTYRRILVFDIKEKVLKGELCQFTAYSRLAYKESAPDVLFPVYYHYDSVADTENGNVISIDKTRYKVTDLDTAYLLPFGLEVGDIVYLADTEVNYDKNYWFYCPFFKMTETNNQNSFNINSIFVNDKDEIFGLAHYLIAHTEVYNSLYGVREKSVGKLYQVEYIDLDEYKLREFDEGNLDILYASYVKIQQLACTSKGDFGIVKVNSSNLENLGRLELQVFDKSKRPIRTFDLSAYSATMALDATTMYSKGTEMNFLSLLTEKTDISTKEKSYYLLYIDESYSLTEIPLNFAVSTNIARTTNYTETCKVSRKNELEFVLNLPLAESLIEQSAYILPLDNIIKGWYTFRIQVDLQTGIFKVFVNDKLLANRTNYTIEPHKFADKNVFNYPLVFGNVIYKNAQTLEDFMGIETESLLSTNVDIRAISMFNGLLSRIEYQAITMKDISIKPLVITLPAGQKNNFEEILRLFKYTPPSNVSNTIRVNIKNSTITDNKAKQALANEILRKINEELALPITIKEINFS